MLKSVIGRSIIGAGLGIAIGYIITVVISASLHTGEYYPCATELIAETGNVLDAVLVQLAVCIFYGAVCGGASVIWDIEKWGLARQTVTYFSILFAAALPSGYVAWWMPRDNPEGIAMYIVFFAGIFTGIWLVQYAAGKASVKRLNRELAREREKQ